MDAFLPPRHLLDALADPTRRAILERLAGRAMSAGEIATFFPQQRPAISKHLTLLRECGWLAETRDRQRRIYALRADAVAELQAWARSIEPSAEAARVSPSPPRVGMTVSATVRRQAGDLAVESMDDVPDRAIPQVPVRSNFQLIFD